MRLERHVPLIPPTLKRAVARPVVSSLCSRCRRSASSQAYPEKVAVLGGGISGLASAYFVAKEFPRSKITVHEANKDSGGWIQSRRVEVPGGDVLFEYGPRTLRPNGPAQITMQLIQDLGLKDSVLFACKCTPGATTRYIYYPDRLQRIHFESGKRPSLSHVFELLRGGLLAGAPNAFLEPFRPKRPVTLEDESIGSFIARRFDERLANNIASAIFHGIYAGDIWKLSARTLLSQPWQLEHGSGSVFKSLYLIQKEESIRLFHSHELEELKTMVLHEVNLDDDFRAHLKGSAVFTFKDGMGCLVRTLQQDLTANKQVKFKFNSRVQDYKLVNGAEQQVEVTTGPESSPTTEKYDLVISTLRNPTLTPFVTVMTVNLYFPNADLIPYKGFGYLIPQSVGFDKNPERALGVIFDSDVINGQDSAKGTKLTVMLGGHYWDGWTAFPSEQEGYDLAMSLLRRHLNIKEEPTHYHVNLSRDCIPQYTVGYEERARKYAFELRDKFKGRVRVVGSQTHGVGVNDCIRGAWTMARNLRGVGWKENGTGLERYYTGGWLAAPVRLSTGW